MFQGVDFPNVKIVGNIGILNDIPDGLQRAGRVVRRFGFGGLFVILYEPWALTIDPAEFEGGNPQDPDRPRGLLKANSSKIERAGLSPIQLVQNTSCRRQFFATYLGDVSPNGMTRYPSSVSTNSFHSA